MMACVKTAIPTELVVDVIKAATKDVETVGAAVAAAVVGAVVIGILVVYLSTYAL